VLLRAPRHAGAETNTQGGAIRIGNLQIDEALHRATVGETTVQLTPTEYRLLTLLAARRDQVVPRDLVAKLVSGDPDMASSRTIDVHMRHLRAKLSQTHRTAPQVIAIRGFGYKFVSGSPGTGAWARGCPTRS